MAKHLFKRNCPKCNREIIYSLKNSFKRAEKHNRLCSSCCLIGNLLSKNRPPTNKGKFSIEKQNIINNGIIWLENDVWYRNCAICQTPVSNSNHDNAYRRRNVPCHKCGISKNIGSKRSMETKNKQRISAINRLQKYHLYNKPNFNPKACDFIDRFNQLVGINLQHALNGGEVWLKGFYPDGYDKEKNIVFEYDEKRHNSSSSKLKDLQRQQIIVEKIKPALFLRYDEKNNKLYDCETQTIISILL